MKEPIQNITQNTIRIIPSLSEYVEAARLIIRELKDAGASSWEIISFLEHPCKSPGIPEMDLPDEDYGCDYDEGYDDYEDCQAPYTAQQIARKLGIYSIYGRPHAHAVSAILNDNIFLLDTHIEKRVLFETSSTIVWRRRYDEFALQSVIEWLEENNKPHVIEGIFCNYRVWYRK